MDAGLNANNPTQALLEWITSHLLTLSLTPPPQVEPASIFKASILAPTILSVPHLLIHCSILLVSPFPFLFYMDLCDYIRDR